MIYVMIASHVFVACLMFWLGHSCGQADEACRQVDTRDTDDL